MLRPVKNWLRKWLEEPSSSAAAPAAQPAFCPRPTVSTLVEPSRTSQSNGGKPDILELPLAAIYGVLPKDLQVRVRLPLDGQALVAMPLGMVLPQLGRGAVKITFGELRQFAPAETFYSQADRDQAVVELPLGEILARLQPATLPRRAQKAVELPAEITSPFAGNGEGLNFYKPETPPARPFNRSEQDDPFSAAPEFPARGHITSVPPSAHPSSPPLPATAPIAMPNGLRRNPDLAAPPSTSSLVQAAAQPVTANGAVLPVRLADLAAAWPSAVAAEIAALNPNKSIVALPLSLVEDALKKGRAVFAWKQIRSWTNPAPPAAASAHDNELLELPLKIIAPLFLAQQRLPKPAQKFAVDTNIPDLFGKVSPAGTAAAPTTNGGNGTAKIAATKAPPAAPTQTLNFSDTELSGKSRVTGDEVRSTGTDFLKRYATPNDIVGRAASLEGVLGALIVLADGLLVASHLPADVNGDALAAFTPQIYVRVTQSAREYRMGELKDLTFTVGDAQWKIFKAGSIFFAAFGKAGEPLPVKELAALAAELDRKPKNQI